MNETESRKPAIRFSFIVATAAIYTLIILQYSFQSGRLAVDIVYDDVVYFHDGLQRLDFFFENGLRKALKDCLKHPPHSPLASFLAMTSFFIFGIHDWAPYAINGIIIAILVWFTLRLTASAPRHLQLAFVILLLTCPFTIMAVHEFRPDFLCALFTAMACVQTLRAATLEEKKRTRVKIEAGIFFGLALLAKPPVFPFTFIMMGSSLVAARFIEADYRLKDFALKQFFKGSLLIIVPSLVISLPHYIAARKEIFNYIWDNVFGKSAGVWQHKGAWSEQFSYFLTGLGGVTMLNRHLWIFAGANIAILLMVVLRKKQKEFHFLIIYIALIFIAYLFPSFNKTKNPFFGLTFQISLFFLLVLGVMALLKDANRNPNWKKWTICMSVLLWCSLFYFRPMKTIGITYPQLNVTTRLPKERIFDRQINREILQTLATNYFPIPTNSIYVTTTGTMNAQTLNWIALKEKLPLDFHRHPMSTNVDECRKEIELAHFVLAGDKDVYGQFMWHPSGQIADKTLELVRSLKNFKLIRQLPTPNGKSFFLYRNEQMVPATPAISTAP